MHSVKEKSWRYDVDSGEAVVVAQVALEYTKFGSEF